MNGPVRAANWIEMYLIGEVRLESRLGPRQLAVDFVVTPQVEFPILGEGCLQDFRLLWDHRLNEVVLEGVHHKLRNMPTSRMGSWRITLQR